jgi:hypothetical protein
MPNEIKKRKKMNSKEPGSLIKQLEEELLWRAARKDAERLNELIADEFIEIGKSGKIYTKQALIDALKNEKFTKSDITDYKISFISDTIALIVYTSKIYDKAKSKVQSTIRSSIWKSFNGEWKMIFHQGTPTTD